MSALQITPTKFVSLTAALSLFALSSGTAFAAAPNLWWDHIGPLDISQKDCIAKGKNLLSSNKAGKIQESVDSLHAMNDTSISVIECLPFGKGMTVMVVVSSSDVGKGDKMFNNLKKGMAK
ncbi:MAG: hypothetical protein ACU843_00520 [Gammaproteobacteria bacterium]